MVRTGLEKSWNLTLDLKSHGILCWPGKMAFCLEKSLKISGSHWKISCAMINLIWTWKHWWLYDKKCHFVIKFETILVKPCLQTCMAELLATLLQIAEPLVTLYQLSPVKQHMQGKYQWSKPPASDSLWWGPCGAERYILLGKSNKYEANLSSINSANMYVWWWCFSMGKANYNTVVAFW